MPDTYKTMADRLEAEMAAGRLKPGDRLPTQRAFADALGIAVSTATRVFAELIRRGLVVGEVGRGTFVRTGPPTCGFPLALHVGDRVNLATNAPVLPTQARLLARLAARLMRRPAVMASAMEPVLAQGTAAARRTMAAFSARDAWRPDPDALLFTGGGRQALAAALAALVPPGQRLGVEALTYQSVAGIAGRLGVEVVPLPVDGHGLKVEALARAHRRAPLRAVYVQPTLQNPLGTTMPAARRHALARALRDLDVVAIEDHVYAFLRDDPCPLSALAPDHAVMIDSLSKRLSPGLSLGWMIAPVRLGDALAEAIRAGALAPSGLAMELCIRWVADGTVQKLAAGKRRDAAARQRILRRICAGLALRADPRAYHAWLELPPPWRAESFTAAAAHHGIAVAPASAFAAAGGHSPNAVRLALAVPRRRELAESLRVLRALTHAGPRAPEAAPTHTSHSTAPRAPWPPARGRLEPGIEEIRRTT